MSSRYTGGVIYNAPGGWSGFFPSNSSLTFGYTSGIALGSTYTIECWINPTSASQGYLFEMAQSNTGGFSYLVFYISSGQVGSAVRPSTSGTEYYSSAGTVVAGVWQHVAVVNTAGTAQLYVNGYAVGSTYSMPALSTTPVYCAIGQRANGYSPSGTYYNGYISNLRITTSAVYTGNFTPPTGALLPLANTKLLTCRYPTFVDGSTNAYSLTSSSATVNTANPFPTSALPNPALGVAGNGIYTMTQYTALRTANQWPAYDPYYKNVTLNLHGNAGAVLPFNTDASTNNFQVTQVGDTRPSNYTPFITNGYWSNYFDGSSYLQVAYNSALDASTGPFTYEAWLNPSTTTNKQYLGGSVTNAFFAFVGSGTIFVGRNNVAVDFTSSTGINTNQWNHVVIVRNSSNNIAIFINGVSAYYNASNTNNYGLASNPLRIGVATTGSSYEYSGYISNVRIAKSALYDPTASTITVPTAPLTAGSAGLLTCQSNRFVDNSSNAFAITTSGSPSVNPLQPFTAPTGTSAYGSGYFDGSGDYLRAPTGYLTGVTTGDFTVEGWWNFGDFTVRTTYFQRLWSFGTGLANDVTLNVDTSGNLVFRVNDSVIASQSSGAMKLNSWNHVALVRSSGTVTIYLNGTSVASAANSSNISGQAGNPFYLGCESDGAGGYFYGYCSNVRITNTAVYTTTFTPSTTPLTAISGTSLLTVQTNAPSQNNTFLDSSTNNFVITRNGNTTQGTFTPYGNNWSAYFDGSGDYLTVGSSGGTAIGSSDFTIEFWVFMTNSSVTQIDYRPSSTNGAYISFGWIPGPSGTGSIDFYVNANSRITASVGPTLNGWSHMAISRVSGNTRVFIDGVQVGSTWADSTTYLASNLNVWWNAFLGARPGTGYFSNYRLVLSGLYSANFTPPTAPLTAISGTQALICQSNRFIDNSSNAYAITRNGDVSVQRFSPFSSTTAYSTSVIGGSGYFDGSGDYLVAPNNSAFDLSTADFTVECWYYFLTTGATQYLCVYSSGVATNSQYQYVLSVSSAGVVQFQNLSGSGQSYVTGATIPANTWSHIAATRTGTSGVVYVNGVGTSGTLYATANTPSGATLKVGSDHDGSLSAKGNITDFRIVKGTRVYTANFTPPTAPLTAITNTSLLLSYTNAGILDNAMMNDLETVGNAQLSTSVKKYGTGSMYFNGTSSSLSFSGNLQNLQFGTGDFTIECWVNKSANGANSYDSVIGLGSTPNGTQGWYFEISTSRGIFFIINSVSVSYGTWVNDGFWHHVAVTRSNGTVYIFKDGVLLTSGSLTTAVPTSATVARVGNYYNGTTNFYYSGYIDDLRVTKGTARYTTSFTPPTSQVQDQ